LAAGPAWRLVQILPRCFLSPPKFLILGYFLKANPSARVAQSKWFEPWTASASETVRTTTSVKPSARPRSAQLLFLGSIGITELPPSEKQSRLDRVERLAYGWIRKETHAKAQRSTEAGLDHRAERRVCCIRHILSALSFIRIIDDSVGNIPAAITV